jgi:2-aminoadipate transaminase
VTWTEPAGGYLIWVRFRRPLAQPERFLEQCAAHRLAVAPGQHFFPGPSTETSFRLSISMLDEPTIVEGIARLGRALSALAAAGGCA